MVAGNLCAQDATVVLTNASDVLALPAESALKALGVRVTGVVTATEQYWDGRFFIQDASGGVFVDNISVNHPEIGDLVEVSGVSHPGAFAPVISKPAWKRLGTAPLPEAKPVTVERLMTGVEDSQRIEISGTVQAVRIENSLLEVDLVSGGYRLHVLSKIPPGVDIQTLVGARVRVKGTAAASFNALLRQLITVKVFVPLLADFIVEHAEPDDSFAAPVIPLAGIAQYRRDNAAGKRVHVRGIVTHQRPGEDLFLKDSTGALQVKSRQLMDLSVGDVIEAVGFPNLEHFLPVLQDAVFRRVREPRATVTARPASAEELEAGLHHADLISLQGKLLDRVVRRQPDRRGKGTRIVTILTLQGASFTFAAEAETTALPEELVSVPIGSRVEVTGICLSQIEEDETLQSLRLQSLQMILPAGQSLRVLERPSWLTPQRLLVSMTILFAILLVAVSWTVVISRKNSSLKVLVREKEQAQGELQHAHDELEERVKERTAQLKFQITARKESELQFKAVLSERTRLAQELHDTLEQTLTGIALQLDTTSKLFQKQPDGASRHLELARSLVNQSQVEVRRSVWDLRSRALEQFDLPSALTTSTRQLTDGTSVRVEVAAQGRVRPLPETIEENLLRIGQEAVTNIIKHSGASAATIHLDYGAQSVVLKIEDNGRGFAVEERAGPDNGHFGLLGISERVKRMNGQISLTSAPGNGTTVRIQIPIDPAQEIQIYNSPGMDI